MEILKSIIKKFKPIDYVIIAFCIIALGVGYYTYNGYRQTSDKQIEATSKIVFKVFMRGVTFSGKEIPIKKGEKTFISIRNVPYTNLDIIDVNAGRRKIVIPTPSGNKVVTVTDDSQPDLYDVVVTLSDNAKITKDGAVVGGNKIKMGLPITLEGANYKYTGSVSDLKVTDAVDDETISRDMNTTDDIQ